MINSSCKTLREIVAKDFERDKTSGKMTLREKPFVRHKTWDVKFTCSISQCKGNVNSQH